MQYTFLEYLWFIYRINYKINMKNNIASWQFTRKYPVQYYLIAIANSDQQLLYYMIWHNNNNI